MATLEEIRSLLAAAGETVKEESRLGNDTGTQLKLACGVSVNVFDKGTFNVQGKPAHKGRIENVLASADDAHGAPPVPRKVFVVYGHDSAARDQLEAMLRRWDVEPIIMDQLPSGGQTIIEKLEKHTQDARFAIVLATPDDEGHLAGHDGEKMFRARQNVVLELGMLFAKLGRERVAILLKDPSKMERPSDIQGLIYISFTDHVNEAGTNLAKELAERGIPIDLRKL